MKVQSGKTSIYAGSDERTLQSRQSEAVRTGSKKDGSKTKSINAKQLKLVPDKIAEKKARAQKKAWDVISKVNEKESSIDDGLSDMQHKISELMDASKSAQDVINQSNENIANIKEEYGVSDDSQEQKDLELLLKEQDSKQPGSKVELTEEEREQLSNMKDLTDYQSRALSYHEIVHSKEREIEQNNDQINGTNAAISDIKVSRLKSHPMVDAQVESNKILEAASKESASEILAEAKDTIDEKQEQAEETANKKAEEKKEEEEKKAEAKEEKEAQEALANGESKTTHNASQSSDASLDMPQNDAVHIQRKISSIIKDEILLEEDIKGIALDTTL